MDSSDKDFDKRIHARNPHSGHIFFATKYQLIEGRLKNFSKYGLFIKTYEMVNLGEFITVALPYANHGQVKVRGQILWRNHEGYGIELLRKRNGSNLKLLKIKAKIR